MHSVPNRKNFSGELRSILKTFFKGNNFEKILPAELRERFDRLIVKVSTSFLVPVSERPTPLCDPAVLYCERVAGASSPEKINSYRFNKFIFFKKTFLCKTSTYLGF
jgi:hypothetical protein